METDTSRQSGQVRWPQSKHLTLNRGHSGRLLIDESDEIQFHCFKLVILSLQDNYGSNSQVLVEILLLVAHQSADYD